MPYSDLEDEDNRRRAESGHKIPVATVSIIAAAVLLLWVLFRH